MDQEEFEDIVREKLKISYLRPYQTLIIRHILDNEESGKKTEILASLPTGSGKTLCFTAPMLFMKGITICIYPLLALMSDQERRFKASGFAPVVFRGGMTREERKEKFDELRKGRSRLIVTNVEMLLSLLRNGELDTLNGMIETVVIDEVHTILEWGESFRPALLKIGDILKYIKPKNIFAFSATVDSETGKKIISLIFNGKKPYIVHGSADRENIYYHAVRTLSMKHDMLTILSNKEMRPCVVFCPSREKTEEWANDIKQYGYDTAYYHALLESDLKKKTESWFLSSKDGVLFATIAYGMGVSKDDIRSIIHTFIPPDASSFLQESGRAGRDGKDAHSFVLYNKDDKSKIAPIFTGKECIRRLLLEAMNEEVENRECLACSHCTPDSYSPSGEKKILSFMSYWGIMPHRFFTKALIRHSILSHGFRLKKWSEDELEYALNILIEEGKIRKLGPLLIKNRKNNESGQCNRTINRDQKTMHF